MNKKMGVAFATPSLTQDSKVQIVLDKGWYWRCQVRIERKPIA
jgi:hypothetical protein